MRVRLTLATADDVSAVAALRAAVAERLTRDFGKGHWSSPGTETMVRRDLLESGLFVARRAGRIVATLKLSTRKPWAIDRAYFTAGPRPLYLTGMAVDPALQRKGIGRACLQDVRRIAHAWPADAIRLDAYDAAAGAGGFYAKCGFREVGRVVYRTVPHIYFELILGPSRVDRSAARD